MVARLVDLTGGQRAPVISAADPGLAERRQQLARLLARGLNPPPIQSGGALAARPGAVGIRQFGINQAREEEKRERDERSSELARVIAEATSTVTEDIPRAPAGSFRAAQEIGLPDQFPGQTRERPRALQEMIQILAGNPMTAQAGLGLPVEGARERLKRELNPPEPKAATDVGGFRPFVTRPRTGERVFPGVRVPDGSEDGIPLIGPGGDTLVGGPAPKTYPTDDGRNPIFKRFRKNLAPIEGAFGDRKTDPGGPTNKGISQKFLERLNRRHPEWKLPKDTRNLKVDHIDGIFRSEFFDRPKIQDVVDIPGLMQKAPQLPEQLFDAGVLQGTETAGTLLQKSLDEHLGTDLRVTKNGKKIYDGNVGPATRAAIARAIKQGKIKAVNDTMVKKRLQLMRNLPAFKNNPGWVPRAKSFRIGSPGGP